MKQKNLFTSESVTEGHPDKVCDQISDAILDECLRQDPLTRAGIETFGNHGLLIVGGEIQSIIQHFHFLFSKIYFYLKHPSRTAASSNNFRFVLSMACLVHGALSRKKQLHVCM